MAILSTSCVELPMLDLTIEKVQEALTTGAFTSVDLIKACLARISEASEFNSVLQVNPEAVLVAEELDEERRRLGSRGPLHDIPILVKDNIVTKDKLDASAGSFVLLGAKPALESSLVSKLRQTGAIILGKTNLSEWANFRGLNNSVGWSPRGKQTFGAYYPGSRSDGSSSGSAVATALGLCVTALGTETFGSIADPAEMANVVGFKSSRGLVATDGLIPISRRQDVIGPITRTVKDAAHMLNVMAGRSERDPRTWNIPFDPLPDFVGACKGTDLSGLTIGIPRNCFDGDPASPIMISFELAIGTLRSAGATVVDHANFTAVDEFKQLNQQVKGIVRSAEFKRDIVDYLATLETNPNQIHSGEDIINFTKNTPEEDYPAKDIGKFLWIQEEGIDVDSQKYRDMVAQELYFGGEGGIIGAMEKYDLDVLVTPSTLGVMNDLAAKMGFPMITVPLGFHPEDTPIQREAIGEKLISRAPGIPYCITFVTKAFNDAKLLQVAHAFEQLTRVRENGPLLFKPPMTELKDVQQETVKV